MFESNATAYYVNNEEWLGSTLEATADMVTFDDNKTVSPTTTWESPTLGIMYHKKQSSENSKKEVEWILGLLDADLKIKTFLWANV